MAKKVKLSRNVYVAGLVSLCMDISSEMVYPLLPLFLTTVLGASKTTVGIIEGIAEATASILKVFSGWLADKFGKKKLLMTIGYGTSALSRPIIAGAGTWFEVLTARFIDRTGKGIRTAPRDALIADSTPKEQLGTAFGFHRMMDTIGAVIGPLAAFIILYFVADGLRLVFFLSAIPAVAAVLLIIFFLKEKKHARDGAALPRLSIKSFNGPFRHYLVVIGIFSLGNFADAFIILRAENLGVAKAHITIIYLIYNLVYALSAAPLGILADRVGMKKMIFAGFLYYSLIFIGFAFAATGMQMWALFPLFGIFKGMSDGTQRAYLASISPPERKATAFGVYHMVVGITLLPASIIAGILWDTFGPAQTFLYGSILSFVAAAVFLAGRRKKG